VILGENLFAHRENKRLTYHLKLVETIFKLWMRLVVSIEKMYLRKA